MRRLVAAAEVDQQAAAEVTQSPLVRECVGVSVCSLSAPQASSSVNYVRFIHAVQLIAEGSATEEGRCSALASCFAEVMLASSCGGLVGWWW